ncbi:tellurite resistance TerB family protein [Urbifossiella limnaea]|uniref:Tellurite resistance protein TerB n=1 Tax=Urbifossiella limnaea TaxID=2528023 RepID=A0A517XQZ5_9BACT|nr:TerB family tellurite resistance protein [Urbifossiella limnaea]QDU19909.1 Tellurite resistance protein TerB [Urbifossiella limnaea]
MLYVLLPFVAVAAAVAAAYAAYRATPAARWRRRVVAHLQALRARHAAVLAETSRADTELARLRDDFFRRHLNTIPTDRLGAYPGIGEKTVEKVKAAAGPFVADLLGAKFADIPEVGPARGTALMKALVAVQADARARFDAGGCTEGVEFRRVADRLRAVDAARAAERGRELTAVEEALKTAFDLFALAQPVSFGAFLRRQNQSKQLADVIARPFPVVVVPPAAPPPAPPPPVQPVPPPVPAPAPSADLFRAALAGTPAAPPPKPAEPDGLARLRAAVGFGLMVAKADGRIAAAERKAVRAFLDRTFGHDALLARNFDPLLEQTEKAVPTEGDALLAVRAAVPAAEWPALLAFAEQVAAASGTPTAKERDVLARIAAALGVTTTAPKPPQAPPLPVPIVAPADHRGVLDIPAGAPLDAELIRRRYANLTDKLDPVKAAALGPEFARMAEQKRAAVRAAAEALLAPLGEPLEKPTAPPPTDIRENALLDDVFG